MGRWQPNAADRLGGAALQLYFEQGFEQTTVAEIADSAGLTARTFFRHFADKREVLFKRSTELQSLLVQAIENAPSSASPIEVVAYALEAAAAMLGSHRSQARQRAAVIASNPELRERDLIKMASLADALTDALLERGVPGHEARLASEVGITVLRVGFTQWISEPKARDLSKILREVLNQLRDVTASK